MTQDDKTQIAAENDIRTAGQYKPRIVTFGTPNQHCGDYILCADGWRTIAGPIGELVGSRCVVSLDKSERPPEGTEIAE